MNELISPSWYVCFCFTRIAYSSRAFQSIKGKYLSVEMSIFQFNEFFMFATALQTKNGSSKLGSDGIKFIRPNAILKSISLSTHVLTAYCATIGLPNINLTACECFTPFYFLLVLTCNLYSLVFTNVGRRLYANDIIMHRRHG
jgi:hypothetical protein